MDLGDGHCRDCPRARQGKSCYYGTPECTLFQYLAGEADIVEVEQLRLRLNSQLAHVFGVTANGVGGGAVEQVAITTL
ncbi:MAG: hypothetical protein AAF264_03555 [Pseudomonadota bacterium]